MNTLIDYIKSTMLIERLFGVGVYVLALGYFYNKIQHSKDARAIAKHLNHYLVVLCVMAFFYIPGQSADLYRWRLLAEPWKKESFSWFWSNRVLLKDTPLGYLFIYLCQMTGINGLLPMLCALGFFSNVFHIFKSESKRTDRNPDSIAVVLLFVMSTGVFLEVISGIRCMLAFSIVVRHIYAELYENKSILRSIPYYIVAALLHSASIPLIGIRLFCSLFEKKRKAIGTAFSILITVVVFGVAIKVGEDYIDASFNKASSYITNDQYSYIWEHAIAVLVLFVLLYFLIKYRKKHSEKYIKEKSTIRILYVLLLFQIVTITSYTIFHRFVIVSALLSIPTMLSFLNSEHEQSRVKSRQNIVILSLMILFIACVRGNLCGYKFFLFS